MARRALQRLGADEARRIVRNLVLLGPANFGAFSAAFALLGAGGMIRLARRLAVEPTEGFQQVLATFTGLYQLLPFDADRVPWLRSHDLGNPAFWSAPVDETRLRRFHGWARAIDTTFFNDRTTVILGDNGGEPTAGGLARRRSVGRVARGRASRRRDGDAFVRRFAGNADFLGDRPRAFDVGGALLGDRGRLGRSRRPIAQAFGNFFGPEGPFGKRSFHRFDPGPSDPRAN